MSAPKTIAGIAARRIFLLARMSKDAEEFKRLTERMRVLDPRVICNPVCACGRGHDGSLYCPSCISNAGGNP